MHHVKFIARIFSHFPLAKVYSTHGMRYLYQERAAATPHRLPALAKTMLEIDVQPADGYAHLILKGVIDSVNQSEPFVRAVEACQAHGYKAALIDGRSATRNLTTVDLYDLGARLHDLGLQGLQVALVNESYDFGITTKFLETVARNRGQNLKAFDHFEEAVAWVKKPNT